MSATSTVSPNSAEALTPRSPWRRYLFWSLILISLALLVVSPAGPTLDRIKDVAPWIGLGLLASEAMFILGLLLMAGAAGVHLGFNPMRWKSRTPQLLNQLNRTKLFWGGLAINTIGALGTGLVIGAGVISGLPWQSWGLLAIPAADLALTISLRTVVLTGVRAHKATLAESELAPHQPAKNPSRPSQGF